MFGANDCHCSVQLASTHLPSPAKGENLYSLMLVTISLVCCLGEDLSPASDAVVAGLGGDPSLRAALQKTTVTN